MKVAGSDVHLHRNRQLFVSHPRLLKAMEGAYERENWHLPSKNNIKIWECCLFDSKNQKSRRNKRVPLTVYLNRFFFFFYQWTWGKKHRFFLYYLFIMLSFSVCCEIGHEWYYEIPSFWQRRRQIANAMLLSPESDTWQSGFTRKENFRLSHSPDGKCLQVLCDLHFLY